MSRSLAGGRPPPLSASVAILVATVIPSASSLAGEDVEVSVETGEVSAARGDPAEGSVEPRALEPNESDAEEARLNLRSIFDPTVVRRRAFIENELKDLDDDAWIDLVNVGGLAAIGPIEDLDLALNVKLPVAYYASENPPARVDAFGLGDLEVTPFVAARHASWFGHGLGVQATFNTATDDLLGDNIIYLKPVYSGSISPFSFLTLVNRVEYSVSVYEEPGAAQKHSLELDPSVNLSWPEYWRWFLGVQYKGLLDFENGDRYTNRMQVSMGKIVGSTSNVTLYTNLEFPLDDRTDQYIGRLGLIYFFD